MYTKKNKPAKRNKSPRNSVFDSFHCRFVHTHLFVCAGYFPVELEQVYFSQDQLGGPQIMVPNGITHQLVQNDQDGAGAILKWLSFVPKDTPFAMCLFSFRL